MMNKFRIVDTRFRILKGGKIGLAMSLAMIGGILSLSSTSAHALDEYSTSVDRNVNSDGSGFTVYNSSVDSVRVYATYQNSADYYDGFNWQNTVNTYPYDSPDITISAGTNITGEARDTGADNTLMGIYSEHSFGGWDYDVTDLSNSTVSFSGNNDIRGLVGARWISHSGGGLVSDTIGTINLNDVDVVFHQAVDAHTININAGSNTTNTDDFTFYGDVTTNGDGSFGSNGTIAFNSAATVKFNGNVAGNIDFNGNDGVVTLAANKTIDGSIDTTGVNGTLIFKGAGTVTGDVSSSSSYTLKEVRADGTGNVLFTAVAPAEVDHVNYQAAATIGFNGGLDLSVDTSTDAVNTVTFNNHDGVLQINNSNLTGIEGQAVVTTTSNNLGTVTMVGGSQEIFGNIGSAGHAIKTLNIGGNNTGGIDTTADVYTITTAHGDIYAQSTVINNDTVDGLNGSELSMASGYDLHSTVTTSDANMGTLKLLGGDQIVTGNVGTNGMRLAEVDSGADGATSNFGTAQAPTDVFAVTVQNTGTGTSNFSNNVTATDINVNDGISEFTNNVTAATTTIGTGIASFNTNGTGATATNIIFTTESNTQTGASIEVTHGLSAISATANLYNGLTGSIDFNNNDATVNLSAGKTITGNVIDSSNNNYGYVNFLGNGTVTGEVYVYGINIGTETTGTVGFSDNVLAGNDIWIHNDSTMVMASGKSIGIDRAGGVGTDENYWTNIGTMAANTGTLTMAGGTQVVDGDVGVIYDASANEANGANIARALKLINAGATGGTTTFNGMVFATTLQYSGNGIVVLNGQNPVAFNHDDNTIEGMVGSVNFGAGGTGTLQIGDGINLTTGTNGIQFANANEATMVFNGDSTVTDVVGGNTAGRSTLAEIYAGVTGKTVTFTNDVHVMEGGITPATFYVSGTGTVNFQGNLNGDLVYNADGVVNVSNTKSILVSTVPVAVTTVTDGTGTLNYLGSTTLDTDIGTSALKLKSVTFNSASNNITQNIGYNVYANDTTIGHASGGDDTAVNLANVTGQYDYAGATAMKEWRGQTAANITANMTFGGNLAIADAKSAINFGKSHVDVLGDMITNNGAMSFTVNTLDISSNFTGTGTSTSEDSARVNVDGDLNMAGNEQVHINYVGSLANSGSYTLIDASGITSTGTYDENENTLVSDNSFSIDTTVKTVDIYDADENIIGRQLVVDADRTGAASGTAYAANQNYVYKSGTLGDLSNNAATVLGGIAAAGNQTGDMVEVIQKMDIDSFGFGNNQANLAVQAKRLAPTANASLSQSAISANTLTLNTVSNRIADLRGDSVILPRAGVAGMSAGDETAAVKGVWAKVIAATATQEKDGMYDGYKTRSAGLAMGIDREFSSKKIVAGLAFGYTNTDIDQQDFRSGDTADTDSFNLVAYASKNFERAYVEGALSYAKHNTDSTRATAVDRTATADIDADQYTAHISGGYRFNIKDRATVTPFLTLDYTHLAQDGYTESGADAINLTVDEMSTSRTTVGGGLRVGTTVEKGSAVLRPELKLAAYHISGGSNTDITAQYVGGGEKFVTPGTNLSNMMYNVGLGLKAETSKSTSFGVSIDYDRSSDGLFQGYTGQLVGRYEF